MNIFFVTPESILYVIFFVVAIYPSVRQFNYFPLCFLVCIFSKIKFYTLIFYTFVQCNVIFKWKFCEFWFLITLKLLCIHKRTFLAFTKAVSLGLPSGDLVGQYDFQPGEAKTCKAGVHFRIFTAVQGKTIFLRHGNIFQIFVKFVEIN